MCQFRIHIYNTEHACIYNYTIYNIDIMMMTLYKLLAVPTVLNHVHIKVRKQGINAYVYTAHIAHMHMH